jgi:tRNA dimethylallyltransferase
MHLAKDSWFLTGPTASGKTKVGVELARLLNAEIISLDSMAVYRDMNIGTAKPSAEERAAVPHHLIDILDPNEQFSVSDYISLAEEKIREIQARECVPLFVGGTPLYLKAILRGIFPGPPADWEFRRRIEEEVRQVGLDALHQRLMQVDPLSATKLHPHDKRRMIRALEVYTLTGQPISHVQTQFEESAPREACKVFALQWPRPLLHQRIEERVDQMFAQGFVDEVRALLNKYGALSRTASQAVGYREVIDHVQGKYDVDEARERVKIRTRQFARRQQTWFRGLSECRFVDRDELQSPKDIAARIVAQVMGSED